MLSWLRSALQLYLDGCEDGEKERQGHLGSWSIVAPLETEQWRLGRHQGLYGAQQWHRIGLSVP